MSRIVVHQLKEKWFDFGDMKRIVVLAIPVIVENILQVLLGTTDTFFASRLSEGAIAGIGITNLIMNIYIAFFTAIGVGATAIISRNIGLNNEEKATESVRQAILLTVGISFIVGVISFIFAEPILMILGVDNDVMKYALPFFITVAVPCIFLSLTLILSSSLRGAGDTKTPMIASAMANVINIILNYILIFGIANFKGLGIVGAGLATTISRMISVAIILFVLCKGKGILKLNLLDKWKIDKSIILSISRIGMPAGIEKLIMRFGQLVYGSVIVSLGTSSYVAHNIAGTIESYSYLPAMGFGVASATLIGQSLGAKKFEEAKRYGILSNLLSTVVMVVVGIVFFVAAPSFAKVFTGDVQVQSLVTIVLRIIALFQPFLSITMVISSALQGAGDTKFPMYSTLIGIWGIRVVFGYIFAVTFRLGLVGIWLAYSLDISVRGIILIIRFLKGKWTSIDIS